MFLGCWTCSFRCRYRPWDLINWVQLKTPRSPDVWIQQMMAQVAGMMFGEEKHHMTLWNTDGLMDWIGWVIDWLIVWLIACLIDWLIDWSSILKFKFYIATLLYLYLSRVQDSWCEGCQNRCWYLHVVPPNCSFRSTNVQLRTGRSIAIARVLGVCETIEMWMCHVPQPFDELK